MNIRTVSTTELDQAKELKRLRLIEAAAKRYFDARSGDDPEAERYPDEGYDLEILLRAGKVQP